MTQSGEWSHVMKEESGGSVGGPRGNDLESGVWTGEVGGK